MMKKTILIITLMIITGSCITAQTVSRNIRTKEYRQLQENIGKGWNTWYNNSVMSHVLLPEGFSINLCVANPGNATYLKEVFKASKFSRRPEQVTLGLRADDGAYTSLELTYQDDVFDVQSASDGIDDVILITPKKPSKKELAIEAGLL